MKKLINNILNKLSKVVIHFLREWITEEFN
jgi:hypothetical protein